VIYDVDVGFEFFDSVIVFVFVYVLGIVHVVVLHVVRVGFLSDVDWLLVVVWYFVKVFDVLGDVG